MDLPRSTLGACWVIPSPESFQEPLGRPLQDSPLATASIDLGPPRRPLLRGFLFSLRGPSGHNRNEIFISHKFTFAASRGCRRFDHVKAEGSSAAFITSPCIQRFGV